MVCFVQSTCFPSCISFDFANEIRQDLYVLGYIKIWTVYLERRKDVFKMSIKKAGKIAIIEEPLLSIFT